MTLTARRLNCPALFSQPRASRRTAQASHAFDLADLANDAAGGYVAQRATVLRNVGGTFSVFYHPASAGRFLEVAVTISWRGTWTPPDEVKVELSVTDGTNTVTSSMDEIPSAFRSGAVGQWPDLAGGRADSMRRVVEHLDRDAILAVGLSASLPWRFTFIVTCGGTVYCEAIEVAEVPRFAVDSTATFGEVPSTYQPRGLIDDHLTRIGATLEAAYDLNRRTYHALTLDAAAPDAVTAASYAVIPGSQSESAGVGASWIVRPRRIRDEPQVLFGVRYKTSGAGAGSIRLATGGTGSPYTLALPATSGAWADVVTGVGYLADAATDTLSWSAQVASGTLSIASYFVVDDP